MTKQELIAAYLQLFAGRTDTYAFRSTWEVEEPDGTKKQHQSYIPTNYSGAKDTTHNLVREAVSKVGAANYGSEAVAAHLYGRQFIGVYPLHSDSTVQFAALDFDGDSPQEAYEEAYSHYRILTEEALLPCYLEISQSGNGYHLWLFFEEPIDAGVVRRAIKQFINKSEWFDRMFPNQSRVTEHKPLGNLIALPLFGPKVKEGKNCFVEPGQLGPIHPDSQSEFLSNIKRIPKLTIENLAAVAPELKEAADVQVREGPAEEGLSGVTKLLDSRFGCDWVRWMIDCPEEVDEPNWYALACNLAQLRGGRDIFHEISRYSLRYSKHDTDRKFNQAIEKNAPHTCEYIRQNLSGPGCSCDQRFPGRVHHPYDLAAIPVFQLMKGVAADSAVENIIVGLGQAYEWAQLVQKNPLLGTGYPYGIAAIDEYTGLRNATLNVLAARPSIGKTALSLDVAFRAADSGIPVFYFSCEMSRQQLWRRMVGRSAGISLTKMVKGQLSSDEWDKFREALAEIKAKPSFPFFVDDTTRDIRQIMDIAWELKELHGHGIVMIDYLGLLDWQKGENEYAGNTRNSKESKLLAKALDMPVLLLHQFNRQGDDMSIGAETFDTWLRSSGQIEQDADVIIYLLGERGPGIKEREVVVQKERDREAGHRVILEFDQSIMTFFAQGSRFALNNALVISDNVAVTPTGDDSAIQWEV